VLKLCKTIVALLLLPVCAGAGWALWRVVRESGSADTVWVATLSGAACWCVIYLLLPKPMWVYVVGHELTHAVWTWLMGGQVKRFKASSKGGHVLVTKSNFLIALAPYFFPLYMLLLVLVFIGGHWVLGWQGPGLWFHLLLGAAYAFHVTLTYHVLKNTQSDITEHGYLFSAVVIFLGNAIILLIGIPLLTSRITVSAALQLWFGYTNQIVRALIQLI